MTVNIKGIQSPNGPEDRDIVFLDVVHNGQTYNWMTFVPRGVNLSEHVASIEYKIYDEIDAKEAAWLALEPKTRSVFNPATGQEEQVEIMKEEFVKPDNPDYYALRRREYPSIGNQLDALWKGPASEDYIKLAEAIQTVKDKYPKT